MNVVDFKPRPPERPQPPQRKRPDPRGWPVERLAWPVFIGVALVVYLVTGSGLLG